MNPDILPIKQPSGCLSDNDWNNAGKQTRYIPHPSSYLHSDTDTNLDYNSLHKINDVNSQSLDKLINLTKDEKIYHFPSQTFLPSTSISLLVNQKITTNKIIGKIVNSSNFYFNHYDIFGTGPYTIDIIPSIIIYYKKMVSEIHNSPINTERIVHTILTYLDIDTNLTKLIDSPIIETTHYFIVRKDSVYNIYKHSSPDDSVYLLNTSEKNIIAKSYDQYFKKTLRNKKSNIARAKNPSIQDFTPIRSFPGDINSIQFRTPLIIYHSSKANDLQHLVPGNIYPDPNHNVSINDTSINDIFDLNSYLLDEEKISNPDNLTSHDIITLDNILDLLKAESRDLKYEELGFSKHIKIKKNLLWNGTCLYNANLDKLKDSSNGTVKFIKTVNNYDICYTLININGEHFWANILELPDVGSLVTSSFLDEIKELFGLVKIGTHTMIINVNNKLRYYILYKVITNKEFILPKKIKDVDFKNIRGQYMRQIREILMFKYVIGIRLTTKEMISVDLNDVDNPFRSMHDRSIVIMGNDINSMPMSLINRWFDGDNHIECMAHILKENLNSPSTYTASVSLLRSKMVDIYKIVNSNLKADIDYCHAFIQSRINNLLITII